MKEHSHRVENSPEEMDEEPDNSAVPAEKVPLNPDGKTTTTQDTNTNTLPTDRGWAWVILVGCVFDIIIFGGIMRSFGVLFLEYQRRFNSSASETATMSLIQNIVISVSALFIMTIGLKKFSCRTTIIFGGLCIVSSYILTAFTTNINVFYFVQGVIGGIGLSCTHPPMLVMLGTYFVKHKGLANSIFTSGASIGGLVFPPIVIKLFEEYGFTGAMLIVAGLLSNIFVAAALMRPPEFYTKHRSVTRESSMSSEKVENVNEQVLTNNGPEKNSIVSESPAKPIDNLETKDAKQFPVFQRTNFELRRMVSHDPGMMKLRGNESPVLERIRANSVGARRAETSCKGDILDSKHNGSMARLSSIMMSLSRSQMGIHVNGDAVCGSFVDVNGAAPLTQEEPNTTVIDSNATICQRFYGGFVSVLQSVFDLNLLRDVSFLYFLVLAFCAVSSVGLIPIFIPTYANEIGIPDERIGLLVSIVAAVDFVSRISMGVVADRKWIKRNKIVGVAFFTVGTACHFVRFIKSFQTMTIFVVIAGLCCGQYLSTYAVILSDIIGQERFKQSLGFSTLTHGISVAIFFPLTGLIRDTTKSYINALHLTGGLAYMAGFCVLTIPLVQKWISSKKKQADEEEN